MLSSNATNQYPAITAKYETDRAIVRLVGVVSVESILGLCDEVDLAVDYYQYPVVELQLASPGGDIAALDHYLSRLQEWRSPPVVRIETRALTMAASAAAIMLSLGDIGFRTAYRSSSLLYHDPRAMLAEGTVATRATLSQMSASLDQTEQRMVDYMVSHIWSGAVSRAKLPLRLQLPNDSQEHVIENNADLRELYATLNKLDQPITPDAAKALYLIDSVITNRKERNA